MTYRFLGSLTRILGAAPQTLNQYGQKFELTEEQAADIRHGRGISAISDKSFCEIFPDGKVDRKDPELADKKNRALGVLHELRQQEQA